MPKNKISEYSTTNSSNTDIESINIDEGCPPSSINNAIRELMVHLKEFQTGSSGDPLTVAGGMFISGGGSANTLTVTGILTASGGTILSSTNTLSGSNIISGNINSSGTTNTFSGGNILSGTNTISGSAIISGNINSSGTTNTFSGGNILSGTNTISGSAIISGNINSSGTNTFSGSNVMSFGAGTSASPSIYFASDTNTGIFSPAADTIAFAEGGVEAMRIDSSGRVGIGLTPGSAQGALQVTSASQSWFKFYDSTAGYNFGTFFKANGTSALGYLGGGGSAITGGTVDDFVIRAESALLFAAGGGTERMRINTSGDLILVGSTAQKATGTTWSNPSDQRLKDNIRDYTKGTAELMQVRVREWEYNGKGGTVEGTKGLGVVADEVMVVLPDTVENYEAKLNADDEEITAIKKFDATEITWLLVKTVQELKTELDSAKARLAALEAN